MRCPDPLDLDALVRGDLAAARRPTVLEHLDRCETCASVVAELARARSVSGQAASIAFGETAPTRTLPSSCAPPAPPGPVIGRYQIHRRLGSGGMGTVFEAWDPQLARQVAIKVLHPSSTGDQAVLRELLVREAQAMAQLAHPNVVAVFDVGTAGQQLFIAMELVRGTTLAHYLQTRRSRREIVDAFAQAGRGLAAAHAAGLVHRDFKPANVLVGADGRVRVTDFGLARSPVAPGAGAGGVGLTHAGQLLGTPSYMSPEQWLGRPADARSDQWSFGVALFEALAGRHPFPAPAFDVLRASVLSGQRAPLPPDLPRALRGVVDRALKLRPEDRYPTMLALLADLDRERVSVVRRIGPYAVLVAGTSALAGAVAIAWPGAGTGGIAACERAADELDEVWDEERGEKLRSKVKGAGPAVEALDAYADAWRAMRTEACEAAARKEQSEELRDLRNACLDQRLALFSGAVRTIEKGAATEPLDLVGGLPPVADCADQERVRSGIYLPPDPEDRDKATEIWKQLGEAASYLDAGRFADAAPLIDRALASAKRLDWEPMIAEAEYRRASLLSRRGDHAGAERGFKDAFVSARAARHDEVMRWSAIQLVSVVGSDLHRPPDAEEWIKNARAEVKRATTDRRAQATLLEHEAGVDLELRRFADARKKLGEAIALREEALGKDHPDVGTARYNLGGTLEKFGDYAAAHDERVRAHAIMRGKYGEGSPKTARYDVGVAHLLYRLGRFDEALAGYRRAIAVYERWPGTETDASTAHEAIARVFRAQGKAAQALPELERALALREKASGADDPTVASVLENLAGALEEAGRPADALAKLDRAERILVQAHGKPAYALADIFAARGSALDALGRRDDAIRAYEEAITVVERAHGRTFVDLGRHLHNLGLVKKKKGDAEGALAAYRRSLEVLQAVYADDHPFVSQSLDANGWLLMDELDRPAEAVPLFERLLAARQKKLGADAKKTQEARAALEEAKKRAAKQPKKKKR